MAGIRQTDAGNLFAMQHFSNSYGLMPEAETLQPGISEMQAQTKDNKTFNFLNRHTVFCY
ncbi:MAG: hypothetical protein AB2L17_05935 [Lentimicrobium sp.]|jgi:hypothetical protein